MRLGLLATAAVAVVLQACSAPHQIRDRGDFLAEATREYPGETRERVIRAAETVMKISDPPDWDFQHNLHGFTGLRRFTVYAVLAAGQGREKWELLVEQPDPKLVRASVTISEAGTVSNGYTTTPYEGAMASIPLYRLFWKRMDYMLGRRPDWVTCDEAAKELEATNTNVAAALSGLCGPTSSGRDAPAPEPLPALPKAAASAAPVPTSRRR